jgi:transcriptional regulator with XRE-family HTH domain
MDTACTVWDVAKGDRAIVVPAFGRLLTQARGHRTPGFVVAKIHGLATEMQGFTRPQLDRYESGRTPRPDPVALFYLAKLYDADLAEWLAALAREREHRAMADERRETKGESPPGRAAGSGRRASSK